MWVQTLDIQLEGIRFQLRDGVIAVSCYVAHFVLQDLASYFLPGVDATDLQTFSSLLPEIEHLATSKYDAGNIEVSGEIVIGTADLLRHGLHWLEAGRTGREEQIRAVRLNGALTSVGVSRPRRTLARALFRRASVAGQRLFQIEARFPKSESTRSR